MSFHSAFNFLRSLPVKRMVPHEYVCPLRLKMSAVCSTFPDDLRRGRVGIPAPESCPCCGSKKRSKLGEDVTETLEVIPRGMGPNPRLNP